MESQKNKMYHRLLTSITRLLNRHRYACLALVFFFLLLALARFQPQATAQGGPPSPDRLWQFVDESALQAGGLRRLTPQTYRTAQVNEASLRQLIGKAPAEFTRDAQTAPVIMALPLPAGTF